LTARHRGHAVPIGAVYAEWSRRFILFHGKGHLQQLGRPKIGQFLEAVARWGISIIAKAGGEYLATPALHPTMRLRRVHLGR
jgi:hypothetical protein